MSIKAIDYIWAKYPKSMILTNYFTLASEMTAGDVLEVNVNDIKVSVTYDTDMPTTYETLKGLLLASPLVTSVSYVDLKMNITIDSAVFADIDITCLLNASSATITIGTLYSKQRDMFLDLAYSNTNINWYNCKYEYAVALYACHLLYMQANIDQGGGGGGQVASVQQGDLMLAYFQTGEDVLSKEADLSRSPYGMELMSLRKRSNKIFGTTGFGGFGLF